MLKYCSGCFKGKEKLLSCSICKTTFFCNIECQRACHELHKKTCGAQNPGILSSWNAKQCMDVIKSDYGRQNQPGSRDTASSLRRLYSIFRTGADSNIPDYGYELHTLTRTVSPLSSNYWATLWAAPGMTNLLLSQKIEVNDPNPNVQYAMDASDAAAGGVTRPYVDLPYEEIVRNKSHEFAYILFYTLTRSATVQQMTMSEAETRTLAYRQDFPGATAAAKRALEIWMKENCGDASAGGTDRLTYLVIISLYGSINLYT